MRSKDERGRQRYERAKEEVAIVTVGSTGKERRRGGCHAEGARQKQSYCFEKVLSTKMNRIN